jgi:uncharacterized repeat protein (TIGR03806 family)
MKRQLLQIMGLILAGGLIISSCYKEEFNARVGIEQFNFPQTVTFLDRLSSYQVFEGTPAHLTPSEDFKLLELSSILFTDYAHKQRLVKIPAGTQMIKTSDGTIDFPNGTILTKTFFYYHDERDTTLGKRIVETRLEIKEKEVWNVATYIWNENQTDAILETDGLDTSISWIDANGMARSTAYHVPTQNECMTCHQSNSSLTPIGPTLLNLNRDVERNGTTLNQITYLQNEGFLHSFSVHEVGQMVDYNDLNASLQDRGRAYLSMNCAHCHNPNGWEKATEREFDFSYETPLQRTGILYEEEKIKRALQDRAMPFIGTTLLDEEGVNLIIEYLDTL